MSDTADTGVKSLGIEISTSGIRAVVIDAEGRIIAAASSQLDDPASAIGQAAELIRQIGGEHGPFERVGVAVPGLVDRKSGLVAHSESLPQLTTGNLAAQLSEAAGTAIVLENDANAAAYGEYKCGAGRGAKDMFYATLGVGVGGAFIFDGDIWHGEAGFAGEFGYVPINSDGMQLEDVASDTNIVRRTKSRFRQDSTSSLGKLRAEDLTLDDIMRAARSEDDFAQMMLGRTGTYVGMAIASVINLLNIERIVIGGRVVEKKGPVMSAIKARASELSFAPSYNSTQILAGELGEDAAAIGAAFVAIESH